MTYTIVILSAFFFSALTFFSGFGLATVLTPVLIIFFPAPIAISLTAVVHFFNNIFKFILTAKNVNKEVLLKFGLWAVLGAIVGSFVLLFMANNSFTINYYFLNHNFKVELVNFVIGLIILFFAVFEVLPQINKFSINKNFLPIGGILSGFFGGLSGHQGAFRSVFLIKCNLSKEQFVATGILIACLVDIVRLFIYGTHFFNVISSKEFALLSAAVIASLGGAYAANKYMHKVTISLIRNTITILLFVISTGLITGIIK